MGEYTKKDLFFTRDLALPLVAKNFVKNDIDDLPNFRIKAQTTNFTIDYG